MKRSAVVLALLAALTLTGCAESVANTPIGGGDSVSSARGESEQVETPTPKPVENTNAATGVDITAPGEVCDPGNMNDPICAAFYPDQVVLNIAERAGGDFAALSDADKIAAAHAACEGGAATDSPAYRAGAIAYCNELAPGIEGQPDRYARLIAFYQALGEDGAKSHFANKTMPTPAELGY